MVSCIAYHHSSWMLLAEFILIPWLALVCFSFTRRLNYEESFVLSLPALSHKMARHRHLSTVSSHSGHVFEH